MWSDDGTGTTMTAAESTARKAPAPSTTGQPGEVRSFDVRFHHAGRKPPAHRWFAVLWPEGQKVPEGEEDHPMRMQSKTGWVRLQTKGKWTVASFELTLPRPGAYTLLVGYRNDKDKPGVFTSFGTVTVA